MREYTLIAGPDGAGKSTLYDICPDFSGIIYVNLDRLSAGGMVAGGEKAISIIDDCFIRGTSFVQETTLCGKSVLANVERARSAGYKVAIHFIGVESPEISISRIKYRVAGGGHNIPDGDVIRRYEGSMERIRTLLPDADEVYFYDNSSFFVKVAKWSSGSEIWRKEAVPGWYENICNSK